MNPEVHSMPCEKHAHFSSLRGQPTFMWFALSKIRYCFRRLPERIVESSIKLRCTVHADCFCHAFAFLHLRLVWDGTSANRSWQHQCRNNKRPM